MLLFTRPLVIGKLSCILVTGICERSSRYALSRYGKLFNVWGLSQSFRARIGKEGRILIPKLMLALLKGDKPNLEGYVMEVTLEPM